MGKGYCCALPDDVSSRDGSKICVHPGGIIQGQHWSCCGSKDRSSTICESAASSGRIAVGSTVVLTPGYATFGDASDGPLEPGDEGILVKDDEDHKPYKVKAKSGKKVGNEWYYEAGAICVALTPATAAAAAAAPATRLPVGSAVVLSPGFESYGDASSGPMQPGDEGLLIQDDRDSKPFKVRVTRGSKVGEEWYYEEGAIRLATTAGAPGAAGAPGSATTVDDRTAGNVRLASHHSVAAALIPSRLLKCIATAAVVIRRYVHSASRGGVDDGGVSTEKKLERQPTFSSNFIDSNLELSDSKRTVSCPSTLMDSSQNSHSFHSFISLGDVAINCRGIYNLPIHVTSDYCIRRNAAGAVAEGGEAKISKTFKQQSSGVGALVVKSFWFKVDHLLEEGGEVQVGLASAAMDRFDGCLGAQAGAIAWSSKVSLLGGADRGSNGGHSRLVQQVSLLGEAIRGSIGGHRAKLTLTDAGAGAYSQL